MKLLFILINQIYNKEMRINGNFESKIRINLISKKKNERTEI